MRGSPELLTGLSFQIEQVPDRIRYAEFEAIKTLVPPARYLSRRGFLNLAVGVGLPMFLAACAPGSRRYIHTKDYPGLPRIGTG